MSNKETYAHNILMHVYRTGAYTGIFPGGEGLKIILTLHDLRTWSNTVIYQTLLSYLSENTG